MNRVSEPTRSIVFAGGGTGGHIFPALAVIEALQDNDQADGRANAQPFTCHVLCSRKPLDRDILTRAGVSHMPLSVRGWSSRPWRWPGFLWHLCRSVRQAGRLLDETRAAVVVAMGGYVAGPVVLAARRRGIPVILINLDAVAGRANRRIARKADRVFSVYPQPGLPVACERIGYPVRRAAVARGEAAECRAALGLDPDRPVLLVTGASLGARTINEAMADLLARPEAATLLADWQVLHLAGQANHETVRAALAETPIPVTVLPFVERMGLAWGAASLAISRCGAGSTGEVLLNAVPTIFLPYPYHADEHQRHNAAPLEAVGGGVILSDTTDPASNADQLLRTLNHLLNTPGQLDTMRQALRTHRATVGPGSQQIAEAVRQRIATRC